MWLRIVAAFILFTASLAGKNAAAEDGTLAWEGWSPEVFARARAEQRFVILDLEAVWCHWSRRPIGTKPSSIC
jgi:uncharacterized protein